MIIATIINAFLHIGNKPIVNGIGFAPSEVLAAAAILALAAGEVDEAGLTRWIRDNWPKDSAP